MKQELNVDIIWNSISDFWDMFEDKEVVSQLWRGYYHAIRNLYYQLYQVDLSKSLFTIRDKWISDWEHYTFDDSTRIADDNDEYPHYEAYPHRYRLPDNIRDVLELRESPRETNHLGNYTVLTPEGMFVTPDGFLRYLVEDEVYEPTKIIVWDDYLVFPEGIDVRTKIFSHDGDDYKVDEDTRSIHFREKPYPDMWSHLSIRDSNSIYSNFACLIDYKGMDSLEYLRQVQGLWYSYWMGSTISDIERGISILSGLPFALEEGKVESIEDTPASITIGDTTFSPSQAMLNDLNIGDILYSLDEPSGSAIFIASRTAASIHAQSDHPVYLRSSASGSNLATLTLQQALDDGLLTFGTILQTPGDEFYLGENSSHYFYTNVSSEKYPDMKFLLVEIPEDDVASFRSGLTFIDYDETQSGCIFLASTIAIRVNDSTSEILKGLKRSSIQALQQATQKIKIGSHFYDTVKNRAKSLSILQSIKKFEKLTDDVHVIDYITDPTWMNNAKYMNSKTCVPGGSFILDSGVYLDNDLHLDSTYIKECVEAQALPYHNFVVDINADAFATSYNNLRVLKVFLDKVKPAYTNYSFQFSLDFQDNVICYDDSEPFEMSWTEEHTDRPYKAWVLDDESHVCLDSGYILDSCDMDDGLEISATLADTVFEDRLNNGFILDDEANNVLDSGLYLDSAAYDHNLEIEWTNEVPEDMKREKTLVRGETFKIEVTLYNDGVPADYPVEDMYSDALFYNGRRMSLTVTKGGDDMPGKYILTGDFDTWRLPGEEFIVNIGVYDDRGNDRQIVASFNDTFYIADSATDLSALQPETKVD